MVSGAVSDSLKVCRSRIFFPGAFRASRSAGIGCARVRASTSRDRIFSCLGVEEVGGLAGVGAVAAARRAGVTCNPGGVHEAPGLGGEIDQGEQQQPADRNHHHSFAPPEHAEQARASRVGRGTVRWNVPAGWANSGLTMMDCAEEWEISRKVGDACNRNIIPNMLAATSHERIRLCPPCNPGNPGKLCGACREGFRVRGSGWEGSGVGVQEGIARIALFPNPEP